MEKYTISELTLIEVAHLMYPLKSLDTKDKVLDFLEDLGYKVPGVDLVDSLSKTLVQIDNVVDGADALIKAETDEQETHAIITLLLAIKEAFLEISKLEAAIKSAPGMTQDFIRKAPLKDLTKRLLDYLIFQDLKKRYPKIFGTLYVMGVLDEKELVGDDTIYQSSCRLKVIDWDKLPRYLIEPGKVIEKIYQWENNFDIDLFLKRFEFFIRVMAIPGGLYKQSDNVKNFLGNTTPGLLELRIPIFTEGVYSEQESTFSQFGLNVTPAEGVSEKKKGFAFIPYFVGAAKLDFEISDGWEAVINTNINIDAGLGLVLRPPFSLEVLEKIFTDSIPAGSLDSGLTIQQRKNKDNRLEGFFLFGDKKNTHLSLSGISAKLFAMTDSSGQDAGVEIDIKQINLLITTGEGDSFITKILPSTGIGANFEVGVVISLLKGFYFKGSAGIEILMPVHIQLGPVDIQGITIAVKPEVNKDPDDKSKTSKIPIEVSSTIKATLGPLEVVVQNIGLSSQISFPKDNKGNLGPVNNNLAFKPPTSLGIAVDAGVIKGGGFIGFNPDNEEYFGTFELGIAEFITVKATCLITTRMPDGSKGFSMLIILSAEFGTPIQLSYGFTLNGVGGLLGLNRTMLLQPLAEGIRTGAVNSVMFPTDLVANAPRIISDLRNFFPAREGYFLIGPMLKIGWGTPSIVTLSLGLIIEIPGNIAILGILKLILPEEKTGLLRLQVNFIGAVEFDKKRAWFYASTYDSRFLTAIIEGQMGVLVAWGDEPNFLVTAGGFHPSFNPPPLPFSNPERISFNLINEKEAKVRVEGYFAVTPNTAQFGAQAELFFGMDEASVNGFINFDALFQFSPFSFTINISSVFSAKLVGLDLLTARVRGTLIGPTPWNIRATFSISTFLGKYSLPDYNLTWGEQAITILPSISAMPLLKGEYQKLENWQAVIPASNNVLVSLRKIESEGLVLHPLGALRISQRFIPLQLTIDKIGMQKLADANRFTLSIQEEDIAGGTIELERVADVDEMFAVAQFKNMTDAKKLSVPAFEKIEGGIEVAVKGEQLKTPSAVKRVVRYKQIMIDNNSKRYVEPFSPVAKGMFDWSLRGGAITKSPLSNKFKEQRNLQSEKIKIVSNQYVVALNANNSPFEGATQFTSQAAAEDFLKQKLKEKPDLRDELHVIPHVEMRGSR